MKLFLAPTDLGWYRFLAGQQPEEVNFWQPSASTGFHALDNGDPLEAVRAPHLLCSVTMNTFHVFASVTCSATLAESANKQQPNP